MNRLALFPLPLVLFPGVPLPLHIFEERYRLLINRCIDEQAPFGVVYHRGESMREVGCSAVVEQVVKRYDDGRLDLVAVGHDRFTIDRLDESGLYLEADVRYLDDRLEGSHDDLNRRAIAELLKYAFYAELSFDRTTLNALTANQLSFLIAGIDLFDMETKQELLEMEQIGTRLERAVEELGRINERLVSEARIKGVAGDEIDITSFLN
jgi:Lon protease-like protein